MKARKRADVDRDRPRLSTSGVTRATVTTGTDHRWQTMMTPTAKHLQTVTSRGTEHSWRESAIDQISEVFGQPQRPGQGEARRHAESVDTGGFQIWLVHHEESRHQRESRRPDDETAGKAEDRTAHGHHAWAMSPREMTWTQRSRSTGTRRRIRDVEIQIWHRGGELCVKGQEQWR